MVVQTGVIPTGGLKPYGRIQLAHCMLRSNRRNPDWGIETTLQPPEHRGIATFKPA